MAFKVLDDKPYAENYFSCKRARKSLFIVIRLELEDIINRGGGDLAIEFLEIDNNNKQLSKKLLFLLMEKK